MSKEYNKEFDDAMRQLYEKLKSIKTADNSVDPKAQEAIDLLDKIKLDVTYTESGMAMESAISFADDLFKRIYSKAKVAGNLGITSMIENALTGDPFFGDVVDDNFREAVVDDVSF